MPGACAVPYILACAQKASLEILAVVLATVGATLLGFVLTAVTILAAAASTRLITNMFKTGHAQILLDELFGAVGVFLVVTTLAVVGLISPESWANAWATVSAMYFVVGVIVLVITGRKFYVTMIVLSEEHAANHASGVFR